jgi:transposase
MINKYYVYGLFEEGNDLPFYIGKGSGRRIKRYSLECKKLHSYMLECKFKNLKNKNKNLKGEILYDGLTESKAFKIEKKLIKQYGKRCDNTGILFNFSDGGNQPPSLDMIKKIYGEDKVDEMRKKRNITYYDNLYVKNFEEVLEIEKMLGNNFLIKEIAEKLGRDRNTISKWIDMYNLKYDNTRKKLLEIERLQSFRENNSKKIQKTSNKYLVVFPNGDEIWVDKMVVFCKKYNLDYKGLRRTFKKIKKNGSPSKSKGFRIKEMIKCEDI